MVAGRRRFRSSDRRTTAGRSRRYLGAVISTALILVVVASLGAPAESGASEEASGQQEARPADKPSAGAIDLYPVERLAPEEGQRRAANKGLLRLKAAVFDPLVDGEPDFTGVLPTGPVLRESIRDERDAFVVQFDTRLTDAVQRRISVRGLEIVGYIPNRALLVRLPAGQGPGRLASVPGVRFAGRYLPGYKLSPELSGLLQEETGEAATVPMEILLFEGESPEAVVEAIEKKFEGVIVRAVRHAGPAMIRLEAPSTQARALLGSLASDPAVEYVRKEVPIELFNDQSVWIGQSYDRDHGPDEAVEPDPKPYTNSATIFNHGITGEGQVIGIADTGLEYDWCFFRDPAHPVVPQSVDAPGPLQLDPDHRKVLAVNEFWDGALQEDGWFRHGTHVSGSALGDNLANLCGGSGAGHDEGDGMAPGAKIVFEDISAGHFGNCLGRIFMSDDRMPDLFEQEHNAGVHVSTNSWGGSGNGVYGSDEDSFVWAHEDFLLLFAAGNDGPNKFSNHGACKDCVAVGATETYLDTFHDPFGIVDPENMTYFSSQGPASDGRIKPDVVTPGLQIRSSRAYFEYFSDSSVCDPEDPNACITDWGGCYLLHPEETCWTEKMNGTSMASPTAAGLAALARQYFTDGFYPSGTANPADAFTPSAALLKAALINSARNMTGHLYLWMGPASDRQDYGPLADAPSNVQGWGRITLDDALYIAGDSRGLVAHDVRNSDGLVTGETVTTYTQVDAGGGPLKATLVWTDPPGNVSGGSALVNDLDLEVVAPDGTVYRGNQWSTDDINVPGDKESIPDPAGTDALNNVESVLVQTPQTGLYTLKVHGTEVPGYQGTYTQGWAMVVTGASSCTDAAPPQNPSAQVIRWDNVELSWDPVPGAVRYRVYRNSSSCQDPMAADHVASTSGTETTYNDTTTQPGALYNYTVRAVMSEEGCETRDSGCVTVETPPPPDVQSVSPGFGINNDPTDVVVLGANFVFTPQVFLGTEADPEKIELTSVVFVSANEIHATVPVNLLPGTYDVRVVNPDTSWDVLDDGFSVGAPLQVNKMFVAMFREPPGSDDFVVEVVDLDNMEATNQIGQGDVSQPRDVKMSQARGEGVVAWWSGGYRVGVINGLTELLDRTIYVSKYHRPCEVAIHPSGNPAYVLGITNVVGWTERVFVVDLESNSVTAEIPVGRTDDAHRYHDIEISPTGDFVYATNSMDDTVSVVRTSDNTEIAQIPVGDNPAGLAVSNDATRLYVSNFNSETISVIDTSSLTVIDTIEVSSPSGDPEALAISPDDSVLYVGTRRNNPYLVTVDLATGTIADTLYCPSSLMELSYDCGTDRLHALAPTTSYSKILEIDPSVLEIETEVTIGRNGLGMGRLLVTPPTVTDVYPPIGCMNGGRPAEITGAGFQGEVRDDEGEVVQEATRVFFDGVEATDVTLVDSGTLMATLPPHAPGVVDVEVRNPNGRSDVLEGGFTYWNCVWNP